MENRSSPDICMIPSSPEGSISPSLHFKTTASSAGFELHLSKSSIATCTSFGDTTANGDDGDTSANGDTSADGNTSGNGDTSADCDTSVDGDTSANGDTSADCDTSVDDSTTAKDTSTDTILTDSDGTDSQFTLTERTNSQTSLTTLQKQSVSALKHEDDINLTQEAMLWMNSSKTFLDYSLIENETEPTIMREAAEFSLFHAEKKSTSDRDSSGVTSNESIMKENDRTTMEGMGLSAYLVPSTPPVDSEWDGSHDMDNSVDQILNNPFDSGDECSQKFDNFDIGIRDTETLLSELKLDEKLLNQYNPPSTDNTFTIASVSSNQQLQVSSVEDGDLSLSTYFQSKSYPLGSSLSADNSSIERPAFSPGHTIVSPPSAIPQSLITPQSTISPVSSSSSVDLTPLITTISPGYTVNLPLPKLELDNLSNMSLTSLSSSNMDKSVYKSESFPPRTLTTSHSLPLTPSPRPNELPSMYLKESSRHTFINDSTLMLSEVSVLPITPAPSRLHMYNNLTVNFSTPSICNTTKFCNFSKFDDTLQDLSAVSFVPHGKLNDIQMNEYIAQSDTRTLSTEKWKDIKEEELVEGESMEEKRDESMNKKGEESMDDEGVESSDDKQEDELMSLKGKRSIGEKRDELIDVPVTTTSSTSSHDTVSKGSVQNASMSFTVLDKSDQTTPTSSSSSKSTLLESITSPNQNSESLTTPLSSLSSPDTLIDKSTSKTVEIKAMLDTTRFNAETFLATLKNKDDTSLSVSNNVTVPQSQDSHNICIPVQKNNVNVELNSSDSTGEMSIEMSTESVQTRDNTVLMGSSIDSLQSTSPICNKSDLETSTSTMETKDQSPLHSLPLQLDSNPLIAKLYNNPIASVGYTYSPVVPTTTTTCTTDTLHNNSNGSEDYSCLATSSQTLVNTDPYSLSDESLSVNTLREQEKQSVSQMIETPFSSKFYSTNNNPSHIPSSYCISRICTAVESPPSHTSTPVCKPSLAYCTPMLSSTTPKSNFHALPMTESPLSSYLPHSLLTVKEDIELPSNIIIEGVSCIYTRRICQLSVKNKTEKWLQYKIEISDVQKDSEVIDNTLRIIDCPSKCFIGPWKQESIKVSFTPHQPGSYTARLSLVSYSRSTDRTSHRPSPSVIIQAVAETPNIQILTNSNNVSLLDYGIVLAGNTSSLPVYIVNNGHADVPLAIAVALNTPSWSCFSLTNNIPTTTTDGNNHNITSLRFVIPGKPVNQDESAIVSLLVHFTPLPKPLESFGHSSPEEYSSKIDICIDSPFETPETNLHLSNLQLKATVGVARLHSPRSLQHICLTCSPGSVVSQSVPLKNVGNIPIQMCIQCDQPDWFTVTPVSMVMQPNEEFFVQIKFTPLQPTKGLESNLLIMIEPNGPTYQIKLMGVAAIRSKEVAPTIHDIGMLECNLPSMFWTGVDIGNQSSVKDLVIRSTYSSKVILSVSIRDPEIFKIQNPSCTLFESLKIPMEPNSHYTFHIIYIPSSIRLQHSFIDILDTVHNKRYKVSLFGYGGQSSISVTNCMHTDQGLVASVGQVNVDKKIVKKLKLTNNGQRPGFVRTLGYPVTGDSPNNVCNYSLQITPERVMIHPQQTKEVEVVYSTSHIFNSDENPVTLVKLVLYTGDEIIRRLVTSLSSDQCTSELIDTLKGYFVEQDTAPSDYEHVPLNGIITKNLLESHTKAHQVLLTGRINSIPSSIPLPSLSPSPAPANPSIFVPHTRYSSVPSSNKILPVQSVTFVDTTVKEFQESCLEIHNPYSMSMKWRISTMSPSFVKEVESSGSVFKSKYTPFWVHQCAGNINPNHQTTVLVTFQPQDVGLYSQIWDLEVSNEDIGITKFRLSFGGRAIPYSSVVPRQKLFPTTMAPPTNQCDRSSHIPRKRTIYLDKDCVEFPATEVGNEVMKKLIVYNRDHCEHKFQVLKPHPPFSIVHYEFTLRQNQCARLPIYFTPTISSEHYESLIGIRTYSGNQMFSELKGRSL